MAMYGYGFAPIGFSSGTCQWDLQTTAATSIRLLVCLNKFYNSAAVSHMGLGRPASAGTNQSGYYGTRLDENDPSTGTGYISIMWNPLPTAPTSYFRRHKVGSAYYVEANWQFPRGLLIPASGHVCMWNIGESSASYFSVNLLWDQ
jgi:hypothetical protein